MRDEFLTLQARLQELRRSVPSIKDVDAHRSYWAERTPIEARLAELSPSAV